MTSMRPKTQATGGRRPAAGPRAFTLVEVLVVILILGILLALVVGVGKTVMREVGRTKTKQIQDIVIAAIRAYYEAQNRGYYPAEAISNAASIPAGAPTDPVNDSTTYYGTIGWWSGITTSFRQENMAAKIRNASLYEQLMAEPASAKKMQSLPPEAIYTTTKTIHLLPGLNKLIRDGYDYDIDYRSATGLGGKPVIISAGPDGYFYRDNNKDYDVDNIRSDGYGR